MSEEQIETQTESQNDSAEAKLPSASDQKITLDLNELKSFMKATVEEVIASSKTEEARKQAEDYNTKIAESVKNTQASLIKPNITNGQRHTDYIKGVLDEDNRRRFQSGEGKALYSDKGEDFIKAKIVLLKKIGLSEEEIAENLRDIL